MKLDIVKTLSDQELKNVVNGLNVTNIRLVRNVDRKRVNNALSPKKNLGISLLHFFFDLENALETHGDSLDITINNLNLYFVKGLGWFHASPGNRCTSTTKKAIIEKTMDNMSKNNNTVFASMSISKENPLKKINEALLNLNKDLGMRYAPTKESNQTYTSDVNLGTFMLTVHVHMEGDDLETFAYDVLGTSS